MTNLPKYIRTKDGKVYDMKEVGMESQIKEKAWIHKPTLDVIYVNRIIKEADTIEELCDEFVFENVIISLEEAKRDCEIGNVYGAIWTDKGLIYVAKMNKKGELELLWNH